MSEDKCNRCGKCCHINNIPCPYLIKQGDKYFCKIYSNRLGMVTHVLDGVIYVCIRYNDLDHEIKGCPLNKGGKPEIGVNLE